MRNHFIEKLVELSDTDPNIFLVVGDLGYGVIEPFAKKFPTRFINAGVAEQSMVSLAAGIASTGKTVFVYSIANFPTFRALEQIRNDVAYHQLPVVIVAVGAGLSYGTLGYTHHAVEDIAVMRAIPNISIYSPADTAEVGLVMPEILRRKGPAYLRLGKGGELHCHKSAPNLSSASISLTEEDHPILLLTTGAITRKALDALSLLNPEIAESVSIFSVPIISDLDLSALDVGGRQALITVEEHSLVGGLGSAVLEQMSDLRISKPVLRLGVNQALASVVGSHEYLLARNGLDAQSIANRITAFLES